jgi:hypothetical protein
MAVGSFDVELPEGSEDLARPIGRKQTEARIAPVSLGVGIGLDQPTVWGTAKYGRVEEERGAA